MTSWLLYCAATGTAFALAALLLRRLLRNRLPSRVFVLLSVCAALALLIPLRIPSRASVYNVIPAPGHAARSIGDISYELFGRQDAPFFGEGAVEETGWSRVAFAVWGCSALLLITLLVFAYAASFFRFWKADPVQGARAFWGAWCRVRVYTSKDIGSPLVVGALLPRILLPANLDFADTDFVDYIVEHELTHVRRFDNALKFISALAVCVHWFNPVVWLLHRAICRDIELSCDEAVLASFGEERKSNYVRVMVSAAERFTRRRSPRTREVFVMFGENDVRERVENVLRYRRSSGLALLLSALLFFSVTAVFATDSLVRGDALPTGTRFPGVTAVTDTLDPSVSPAAAERIAFGEAGEGILVKMEYKVDKRGRAKYDIHIARKQVRHVLEVDAVSGAVSKHDLKRPKQGGADVGPVAVVRGEAERIALQRSGGGAIVSYKLDREKTGRVKYDIEVVNDGVMHEFKIDAETGEVFRYKQENVRKY